MEFFKDELIIDYPEEFMQQEELKTENENSPFAQPTQQRTNFAANLASKEANKTFNDEFQKELEKAQNLVKSVSKQLSKEIPTIDNLKMPEETTEGMNPDSIINKLYSGDSNVQYFLENRYHVRLPIPVYLAQYGGKVKVLITVDRLGNTTKAEPVIDSKYNEQLLSFAKTAALRTKFNPSNKAPSAQEGYIIYSFIAQ